MTLSALRFVPGRLDWLVGATASARMRWLGAMCLLAAALVLGMTALEAWSLRGALAERRRLIAAVDAGPSTHAATAVVPAPLLTTAELTRVNLIVKRLNTPWGAIFDALELQASPSATVLAVEPDVERGAIRIHTEGQRLEDLLRHAGQLQSEPQFQQVQLLRIDTPEVAAAKRPRLTFDLVLAP